MLITTPAVILQAFAYGDTSRILRLATPDHGVQSVIAKGAMRPRSRFGGRLQVLSEGVAQFYHRSTRDLHTLGGFDVTDQHAALAGDLRRFAAAAALAELVLRTGQEEPQPRVFATLAGTLNALVTAPPDRVALVALAGFWHTVIVLGFAPTVDQCVRCERPLGDQAWFALTEGGLLCAACGRGTGTGALGADDQAALRAFLEGSEAGVVLPGPHVAAHRRLLARFVRRHVADEAPLPALAFWETVG
jgi:DNA repair protein RecO (recombination protein O)